MLSAFYTFLYFRIPYKSSQFIHDIHIYYTIRICHSIVREFHSYLISDMNTDLQKNILFDGFISKITMIEICYSNLKF